MSHATEIGTRLWIGAYPIILDPRFRFIVNLYRDGGYAVRPGQIIHLAPFPDSFTEMPPEAFLHDLAELVNRRRPEGDVLVQCQAGLNRSPLVAGLALVLEGEAPETMISRIRRLHDPEALFNPLFAAWLLRQRPREA